MNKENYGRRRIYDYRPDIIVKDGKEFEWHSFDRWNETISQICDKLEKEGYAVLTIQILAKNLRGRVDLHNKPYQPFSSIYKYKKQA